MTGEKLDLKFCVGADPIGMSFIWRVFSNKNKSDVYVSTVGLGQAGTKFSFHQDNLRDAFIERPAHWNPTKDRAIQKWKRAPISKLGDRRETPVLILEVPTDFLSAFQRPDKKTLLVEPAPKHHSTIIHFSYTYEEQESVEAILASHSNRQLIGHQKLPDGTSFLIHSYHAPDNLPPIEIKNSSVFGTIWCDRNHDSLHRTNRVLLKLASQQGHGYVQALEVGGIKGEGQRIGTPEVPLTVEANQTLASSYLSNMC